MDSRRIGAIKHWFEKLLQSRLKLEPVDGWAGLYKRHIPTVANLINDGELKLYEETNSHDAYEKAYQILKGQSVDSSLLEQLKPDSAATGDNFEVAKFLVVLLNELRICQPVLFDVDYGLTDDENQHIGAVLHYLEDQQNWDPYESWPALLFQNNDVPSAAKIFITPKVRRPGRCGITRSEVTGSRRSPLSEVVSSPRSRELRAARERDKKLKALTERCKLLEYEKDDLETSVRTATQETKRVAKSLSEMTVLVNEKESRCQTLCAEVDEWRNKAASDELEISELKQQLQAVKKELSTTQRQLREAEFDALAKQSTIESWQKTATWEEQERLKLERERMEFLQEIETVRNMKTALEEQLRQRTANDEAEITELRNIIDALRSELKEKRQLWDETLICHDEELNAVRKETDDKLKSKESEIARYASVITELKNQLSAAHLSIQDVRSLSMEVRNVCGELENRRVEIQSLELMFSTIRNGYQTLEHENAQKKALIESLRNNAAISEYQSKALAASLEDQQKKHLEELKSKQAILNEKELTLYNAWNQLHASMEMNTRLQEELLQRNAAYQVLEQRLASAEERCSTMSQRFSISAIDNRLADETFKTNNHLDAGDLSFGALPHEYHPLPEVEDENDLLSSSSINGNPYMLKVEPRSGVTFVATADELPELNTSVDSERLAELSRRNKSMPPHLRSTYATELQRLPSENIDEEALKNSENFISRKNSSDNASLISPSSLSKKKYGSGRSLRNVKRRFSKILRDSNKTKSPAADTERSPFKPMN